VGGVAEEVFVVVIVDGVGVGVGVGVVEKVEGVGFRGDEGSRG
jgi:hypothetical protein